MINSIENLKLLIEEDLYTLINNCKIKDQLSKVGGDRIDELFNSSILTEHFINVYGILEIMKK